MYSFQLWVDAHVHLYSMHDLDIALDSAWESMHLESLAANSKSSSGPNVYLLALVEGGSEDSFHRLASRKQLSSSAGQWDLVQLDSTLFRANNATKELFLLLGRQRKSREGLELLTLGSISESDDEASLSLLELAMRYRECQLIIPWGFGKWLGRRGRLVNQCLQNETLRKSLWIGDSGVRPRSCWLVPQFRRADAINIPFLNGTDPLPLKGEERRIGQMGSVIRVFVNATLRIETTSDLIQLLYSIRDSKSSSTIRPYGRHYSLSTAFFKQLQLRLVK